MKNLNTSVLALALHVDDDYDRLLLCVDADDGCPNTRDPWDDKEPTDDE